MVVGSRIGRGVLLMLCRGMLGYLREDDDQLNNVPIQAVPSIHRTKSIEKRPGFVLIFTCDILLYTFLPLSIKHYSPPLHGIESVSKVAQSRNDIAIQD